jgi:hypothetical protein
VNWAVRCGIVRSVRILSPELPEKAEIPEGSVTREDLAAWDTEFNDICARIGPLFYRTDSRAHAVRYLRGLLLRRQHLPGFLHSALDHTNVPDPGKLRVIFLQDLNYPALALGGDCH